MTKTETSDAAPTNDVTETMQDVAEWFAIGQTDEDPFYELFCDYDLDYSLESLKLLDTGLMAVSAFMPVSLDEDGEEIRDLGGMDVDQLTKIAFRTGAYLGEVIRRHSSVPVVWQAFEDLPDDVQSILGRNDISTFAVLDFGDNVHWFPLSKIYKLLSHGMGDSTHFFAQVVLSETGKSGQDHK